MVDGILELLHHFVTNLSEFSKLHTFDITKIRVTFEAVFGS